MKKAVQTRKLFVRREQIARLGATQLGDVVGGSTNKQSASTNPCETTLDTGTSIFG